jgi:hypothetical protein
VSERRPLRVAEQQSMTELQRALVLLRQAHMTARTDRRTYAAFLEIEAILVAREIARRTDWSKAA